MMIELFMWKTSVCTAQCHWSQDLLMLQCELPADGCLGTFSTDLSDLVQTWVVWDTWHRTE